MRLFITGATGTVGRRLVLSRLEHGDRLTVLSRDGARAAKLFAADSNPNIQVVEGDTGSPGPWQKSVSGVDAVIHLAASGVADRRWTSAYRREIVDSRLDGTHQVVNAIEEAACRPALLVSASAVGYYGDSGGQPVTEADPAGDDFLAELCVRWEAEARRAEEFGLRVVTPRIGVVLDERGGALPLMLPFFRWFIGGPLGSGRQYLPWVHWRDLIGLFDLALRDSSLRGAMNGASPNPVTSREFAQTLGRVMERPALLPTPWVALRLVKGPFADFLVCGQRAVPALALSKGYRFQHPQIEEALRSLLTPGPRSSVSTGPPRPAAIQPTARSPRGLRSGAGAGPELEPPAGAQRGEGSGSGIGSGLGAAERPTANGEGGEAFGVITARVADAAGRRLASPTARIRLVAVDVDGTLLRSDGRLTDPVVDALHRAQGVGAVIVLATARAPRLNRDVVKALRLQQPTINCNGAIIWNPVDERAQYHESLPAEIGRAVVAAARRVEPELVVEIDVLDRCVTDRIDPRLQVQISRLVQPDQIGPLEPALAEPTTRINLIAPPDRLARVIEMLQRDFWSRRQIGLYLSHPSLVQVTAPLSDKGIALQRVARRLKASREEVMAIGDGLNDLGMLEWSGFGVALANASPQVKAVADAVAPGNDENGVAWAIERWVVRGAARAVAASAPDPVAPQEELSG
jgi:hypothetical protein